LADERVLFPRFSTVTVLDTEFQTDPPGSRPRPVSLVARDLRSGAEVRLFRGEFGELPPYPTDSNSLVIAYYASAEIGFHLALGWPVPLAILDIYIEFRKLTNGLYLPHGAGLVGATNYFDIDYPADKDKMIALINRGGWSPEERAEIIRYNAIDVDALVKLVHRMFADDRSR
jgi:hypothetical protein